MTERSDRRPKIGKFGERSRGDFPAAGGDRSRSKDWDSWSDPKSKRATWEPTQSAPPPPPSSEEYPPLPRKPLNQDDATEENEDPVNFESTLKAPEASSSSSSYPKKKKYKVADRSLTETQIFELLKDYLKHACPFDSYGAQYFCIDKENKLLEYKYFSRYIYALNLPAACPAKVSQDDPKEETASIAHRIILKLVELQLLGPTEGGGWGYKKPSPPTSYPAEGFPISGDGGDLLRSILQDTRANRFRARKVNLLTIDCDFAKAFGIVVASPFEHSYQLTLNGIKFRLKANLVSEVEEIDWSWENLEFVEKFHRRIIGEEQDEPDLMLVKVKKVSHLDEAKVAIDLESMKDPSVADAVSPAMRQHFVVLLKKLIRLAWWELVRLWCPAEPAPSPLKLHIIFDAPSEKEDFRDDFECLKICGINGLRLAAAVAESAVERELPSPDLSWEYLEKKVQDNYLNKDLAAQLMVKSGFLQMGTRQNISKDDAANMLFALIGAHKMESDIFVVVQLWDYLIGDPDNFKKNSFENRHEFEKLSRLKRANDHTAGCPRYLGRTSSYMEFGEVILQEGKRHFKALLVRFEESSDGYYRWNGPQAEEKRPNSPEWKPVVWNPVLESFCSPSMKLPNGEPRPLPNKVCAWLRGRCMKKLVSIKHSMEITPAYRYLREVLDNEDGKDVITLYVEYTKHGSVGYRRDPLGGLGKEIQEGQIHLLSYSETKKTLISSVIAGAALPRKVVTWMLEGRNLSELIPGRKRSVHDLNYEEDKVSFVSSHNGKTIQVQATKLQRAGLFGSPGGCLFEVLVEDEPPKVPAYSEDKKEWVYNHGKSDEDVIPWEALTYVAEKSSNDSGSRLTTPTSVRKYFPKASGTAVAKIEQQTDHRFHNVKLLAEALTHCSAVNAVVQPHDQLAFVGHAAIECYASEEVMKAVTFFKCHLVVEEGPVNHRSFCAPKSGLEWDLLVPEAMPDANEPGSLKAMKHRLMACCNHVGYAASCIKNDLHKNINLSSTELQEHIEKVCKKSPKEGSSRWPQLFKVGAPKALGDVFLAVIGAISMDSDHNEAKQLMHRHYRDSAEIYDAMGGAAAVELKHSTMGIASTVEQIQTSPCDDTKVPTKLEMQVPLPVETIRKALQSEFSKEQELALVPSLRVEEGGELPEFVTHCKDLQVVEVEGYGKIACSSPRATVISLQMAKVKEGGESLVESEAESSESSVEEDPQAKTQTEQDGAIFCEHCQMWLNGPTQWADHEIGKKHRKAVHRQQASNREKGKRPQPPLPGLGGVDVPGFSNEPEKEIPKGAEERKPVEQHETIYCKHCEMWLNGPTQWADHEIGKKHQKAIRRDQGLDDDGKRDKVQAYEKEERTERSTEDYVSTGPKETEEMYPAESSYLGQEFEYNPWQYEHNPVNTFHQVAGGWVAPWGDTSEPQYPPTEIPMPLDWQ